MFGGITAPITGFIVNILSPILAFQPHIGIFIFTAIITLLIFGINRVFVNRKAMKSIKEKMTEIRENLTKAQKSGDKENTNKFLNEYFQMNSQYMKQSFKVMIISMVVVVIFLPVLNAKYSKISVVNLPISIPFIGSQAGWLFWYFLSALAISWVAQRIMRD
jgi:uncharacterized membrane protein (DUF106 family)